MAGDNSRQIADWNGPLGERWAALQEDLDRMTGPFGEAALEIAGASLGERVIDIGCGCGDTTLALARQVGPDGEALGVDVSRPMLEVARSRALAAGLTRLSFEEADAATARLPVDRDLIYSRFGVMFFADPAPAFTHLRRSLNDAGRLSFVCWRGAEENLWASVPLAAASRALELPSAVADPFAPGPFAFANADAVRAILLEANFKEVLIEPFDAPVFMGETARSAAEGAARMGPLGRLLRETDPKLAPMVIDAVESALAPLASRNGVVSLPGRAWIVAAQAG